MTISQECRLFAMIFLATSLVIGGSVFYWWSSIIITVGWVWLSHSARKDEKVREGLPHLYKDGFPR